MKYVSTVLTLLSSAVIFAPIAWGQTSAGTHIGATNIVVQSPDDVSDEVSGNISEDIEQTQAQRYQEYLAQKQSQEGIAAQSSQSQERCITIMSSFPNNGALPRYQFFKLSQDMAIGNTPVFRAALDHYGNAPISDNTPILDVVETIANPVLRQAAPELIVANMGHIIDFADDCASYLDGQIQSLRAVDSLLAADDIIIAEDALYLRQILLDSLSRLGAGSDLNYKLALMDYEQSLLQAREDIEFAGFEADISDVEALFLTDLDGRLARSNDLINSEINQEALGDAVILSNDLSNSAIQQEKTRSFLTLINILGGR